MSESIQFLRALNSQGPWHVNAITQDRKVIAQSFQDEQKLAAWIDREQTKQSNLYYSVNPLIKMLRKKARREDIAYMGYLHVDLDPRPRTDLEEEQKRILALLTNKLPAGIPEPTMVVFSGGGYQALWKLKEPVEIGGSVDLADSAALYNKAIELELGGDHCHNLDRILRLPGTINFPDEKKKAAGRLPAKAKLVFHKPENQYILSQFKRAEVDAGGKQSVDDISIDTANVKRIDDLSVLDEWNVSDRVKVIINLGHDPENPKESDNSRSAWVFDACCQLVRHEVPDETIYSILTDPGFGISESVLKLKRPRAIEKYAKRQIKRAKEESENSWMADTNRRYAVIGNYGGKTMVMDELNFDIVTKAYKPAFIAPHHFKNWMVEPVTFEAGGKTRKSTVGELWFKSPHRREYERVEYAPMWQRDGVFNLWRGYRYNPSNKGSWALMKDHISDNICSGDPEIYSYVINWMADRIQNPGRPAGVALVMRGGKGVGKSFFATQFGKLFGAHFLAVTSVDQLLGRFNRHLHGCSLVFADEAFYAGDKKNISSLKTLITENLLNIEAKGVDVDTCLNTIGLIMSSNEQHVIPASADERRFCMLEVGDGQKQSSDYFEKIKEQLNNGGYEAMLYDLQHRDLTNFQIRDFPNTKALTEQKLLSLGSVEAFWYGMLQQGHVFPEADEWPNRIVKSALFDLYCKEMERVKRYQRESRISFGMKLNKICPRLATSRAEVAVSTPTPEGFGEHKTQMLAVYKVPSLTVCRELWEKQYGKMNWKVEIPNV